MKTIVVNADSIVRSWYVVDAAGIPLGRLASRVASLLIGKHKPAYSPNQDHGDYVIVVNAGKLFVTGRKMDRKTYFRHSTKPGNAKYTLLKDQMAKDPTWVIRHAVRGMVSRNTPLGRKILKKLHVYGGDTHEHAAQKPQPYAMANK